jgi:multiple sugar transport system permease protein
VPLFSFLKELHMTTSASRPFLTRARRRTLTFYAFITPWLLGFILLAIIPLIIGVATSFTNYDGLNIADFKWVGFKNYQRFMLDKDAQFAVTRTVMWGLVNVPAWLTISFAVALILNQPIKGSGFFRTLYYLPSIVPPVAAINAWKILLDKNLGVINGGLLPLFGSGAAPGWLTDYALGGLTTIAVWGGLGGGMIIFLAGLQNIPEELKEAARIDGANNWQVFRHITLPMMTPVLFFQLVMGLIGAFQQVNLPLILATANTGMAGFPPRPIYLYMVHTYRQIFIEMRYGYGTALLWMLFIAILLLTAIVFWSQKFWVYDSGNQESGS